MVITTVVFDLGQVLIGWDPYLPLASEMSRAEWQRRADAANFTALNLLSDGGTPTQEIIARAAERDPAHGEFMARYFTGADEALTGPIPGTAEIVAELKAAGIRVLGLTNWSAETIHLGPAKAPAIGELEGIVVSGEERVTKPDPEIFRRLIARYDLDPVRTVFIDDSSRNVAAAAELGFVAIQFTDAAQLRARLAGVL